MSLENINPGQIRIMVRDEVSVYQSLAVVSVSRRPKYLFKEMGGVFFFKSDIFSVKFFKVATLQSSKRLSSV